MVFSRKLAIPLSVIASIALITPANALKLTSSLVSGSSNPVQTPGSSVGDVIMNGGFTIEQISSPLDNTLGNGIDEKTSWLFDFTGEDVGSFLADGPISSAVLTLGLSPQDSFILSDFTGIVLDNSSQGNSIPIPSIPGIPPVRGLGEISIDLISAGFSGSDISDALVAGTPGQVGWFYRDDAIISSAQLELDTTAVPTPAPLLGLIGMGVAAVRKRKQEADQAS